MTPPALDLSRISILVVDDNPFMCRLVRTVLQGFGVGRVLQAENIDRAKRTFARARPDIVITDCEMPEGDGLSLITWLRDEATSTNPFVPIIMLTAHTERSRMIRARDAGVNEIIRKPMTVQALYARVFSVVAHPRQFIRTESYFGPELRSNPTKSSKKSPAHRRIHPAVVRKSVDSEKTDAVII